MSDKKRRVSKTKAETVTMLSFTGVHNQEKRDDENVLENIKFIVLHERKVDHVSIQDHGFPASVSRMMGYAQSAWESCSATLRTKFMSTIPWQRTPLPDSEKSRNANGPALSFDI